MILHHCHIEQTTDREERVFLTKELVMVRTSETGMPLAMVRKRRADETETRASIVLLHGYGQNRYVWHLPGRSFSAHLASAGYDVFNLELRGHGRSRHLGSRLPADVSDFVREDVPAALAEVQRLSGSRRVFLVGHSLGGLVSYAAAAALPELVAGVVSIGSPYHFARGSRTLTALGDVMLALDRRVPLGSGMVPLKHWAEAVRLARVFIESPIFPLPIRGFSPGSIEPRILSQHMSLAMDQGSVTVLRNLFISAAEARRGGQRLSGLSGYARAFEALDLPLLVIAGSRDDLAPPTSVEPAFDRSRSSDKTYRVFPRGHLDLIVGRDAPQTIWPLVEAWLATHVRLGEFERFSGAPAA
jgi:alpha-beta hydrolase superfamily lysophospholipase